MNVTFLEMSKLFFNTKSLHHKSAKINLKNLTSGILFTDKICVPVQHLEACQAMLEVETKSKATLECVTARDR